MDIYKYAEEYNYTVDYFDMHTGKIFKITEAQYHFGKIPVYDADGKFLGYAKRKDK